MQVKEETRSFEEARFNYASLLTNRNAYATLALLSQCSVRVVKDYLAPASLHFDVDKNPVITLDEFMANNSPNLFTTVLLSHELRHIPQLVRTTEDYMNMVRWPALFTDKDEATKKKAFRKVHNAALDMALNEQLRKFLADESKAFMKEYNSNSDASCMGVWAKELEGLEGLKETLEGCKDDFERVNVLLACHYTKTKGGPFLAKPCFAPEEHPNLGYLDYIELLLSKMTQEELDSEDELYEEFDKHFEGDAEIVEVVEGTLKRAEHQARVLANKAGTQVGDMDVLLPEGEVPGWVKKAISKIKVTNNRLAKGNQRKNYTFNKKNRTWGSRVKNLPGSIKTVKRVAGVFVVLDTSGSVMWSESVLRQLKASVEYIKKQHNVAKIYTCDVELAEMDINMTYGGKGGGGTNLGLAHIQKIRQENNLDKGEKIAVIYLTDGYVDTSALKSATDLQFVQIDLK